MGYCISVNCDNFSFDVTKAENLMRDVKEAFFKEKIEGRWIYENAVIGSETIEEMFEELRFSLYKDGDKYKIDYFMGEKLDGCEEELFKSMAKYIDDGYLEYIGEDGEQWRYIFKNGECREVYPEIVYDIISYDTDIWDLETTLNKVGINIKTADGEFRKLEDVLNDLSIVWEEYVGTVNKLT